MCCVPKPFPPPLVSYRRAVSPALFLLQVIFLLSCGGGGLESPASPTIRVSVSPQAATVSVGNSQQFTATVTGTTNQAVSWSVNDLAGGSSAVGTIDATGLYTAPAVPPSPNTVTVKAASVTDPTRTGGASVTITNPLPNLNTISPSSVDAGSGDTGLTVTGSGFTPQSVVRLGATQLATTFGTSTQLTATIPAAQLASAGTLSVTVVTPSPGGGTSNTIDLAVLVVVAVSPATQSLNVAQTQQFTATVTGTANQAVSWSVNDMAGGNATVGSIDASGLYTAPAIPPSPNVVAVKATSVADPTRTAEATVTVVNPAPALTSISPSTVNAGSSDTTLTVTGTGFTQQSTVQLAGTPITTIFSGSSTQLTTVVPAAQLASAGMLPATVVTPDPGGGTSNTIDLAVLVVVSVSPATQSLNVTQTQQFTATVTGTTNQAVSWSVNDVAAGNATVGSIDASGLYIAPAVPPSPNTVTVKAASVADPARAGTASVTVVNPAPTLSSIYPSTVDAGSGDTTLLVTGSGFASQSVVHLSDTPLPTTFGSATQLTALIPAAELVTAGMYAARVVTPSPGGGTSNTIDLVVLVLVAVSPATQSLSATQTQQFTATVTGTANQAVSWSVNDVAGGNATVGSIGASGLYTAPAIPPSPNVVTVKAASLADPSRSSSASVSIDNPLPAIGAVSPFAVDAGSPDTTLTISGTGFTPQSTVMLGANTLSTTFGSSTQLTATVPAGQLASAGTLSVTVATPSPGGGTSNTIDLAVLVVVAISPATQSLSVTRTQQFTATVTGTANQAVSWSVNDMAGGNATVGSIDASGLYTAPAIPPSPNVVAVKATSVADPTRTAEATVTVVNPAPALTSISPTTVNAGSSDTTLTVTGMGFTQQSTVQLAGTPITTIFSGSSTQLTAVIPAALLTTPGTSPVRVVTPVPGGGTSNAMSLTIFAAVRVTPSAPTLVLNETRQFTAAVSGESDQTVTWFVNDLAGGDSTLGTISTAGLYIAPGVVPSPETVTIKAVSVVDPTKSGTALATVTLPPADNYPRPGAGSILRTPPPLLQVPQTGSAIAVLDWTSKDPDGTEEDVLSLCNSLSPLGIPHVHTTDLAQATGYAIVAVAGDFEDNLSTSERDALVAYVQAGGILFLWNVTDPSLLASLGIGTAFVQSGEIIRPLTFEVQTGDPALRYIDDDSEINLQMVYPPYAETYGYNPGSALALAFWDYGGEAAALRSDLGTGRAYVFGWRLRHVVTDAEVLRDPGAGLPWTNAPVLDADIQKMLFRGVYEDAAGANAQLRQFAPNGKHAALIVTHDVDDITSYERTPEFAQLEHNLGLKATFNFTTSPYDTGWVETFYDADGRLEIQQALDLGHDIGSHSIGHFPDFDLAPFGSGTESAANYFPRYSLDLNQTLGMSVLGELGVSRWLLENDFGITVEIFRSGYLYVPDHFLEGLEETGYRHDSTYAAGVTRGSLPFVAFSAVNGAVTTYPIVEYPLAISDDQAPLDSTTYAQYLDAWESVIRANYANNAPTVLLIHPIEDTFRTQALQDIIQRVSDLDLWIGDLKTFAQFWEAQGVTCSRWP
jgi:peptidoglycan/xylan/chitin deacetylase (PgdA/CDA1 family)